MDFLDSKQEGGLEGSLSLEGSQSLKAAQFQPTPLWISKYSPGKTALTSQSFCPLLGSDLSPSS